MIFTPCKVMLGHSMVDEMEMSEAWGTYKVWVEIPNGKKTYERTSNGREGNRVMLKQVLKKWDGWVRTGFI